MMRRWLKEKRRTDGGKSSESESESESEKEMRWGEICQRGSKKMGGRREGGRWETGGSKDKRSLRRGDRSQLTKTSGRYVV
eukprot:767344-Hanusia_phi.AAC.1